MATEEEKIGTVELLRMRVYNSHGHLGEGIVVQPGIFDLFTDGEKKWWVMPGHENDMFEPLGDGMFRVAGDRAGERAVTFDSIHFSPEEWAELLDDECTKPGPAQRLIITEA